MMQSIHCVVNGEPHDLLVHPLEPLLETLRVRLRMAGTKEGCSTGYCGACTVLLDGSPVNACLLLTVDADRHAITTIEGLARDGVLAAVQAAFVANSGLQCGYCTPGMILSASALLAVDRDPSEAAIRAAIAGNICRCTGYQSIVASVREAGQKIRAAGDAHDTPQPRPVIRSRA
ncbi:MAG TPA: (2Fe-2S)-binding protein [Candidatus Eremiobacteraceae bacterium]|nr:(2Fe-2S)-binding protein [Candidatus Eremiobacteraceae bacterium]